MSLRAELMEALLENHPDGVILIGIEGHVVFWNPAAEALTGYYSLDLLGRDVPESIEPLLRFQSHPGDDLLGSAPHVGHGSLVHFQHRLGHELKVIARLYTLRDSLSKRIGTAVIFHPAESMDALPHGECGDDETLQASQAEIEDRLSQIFLDFERGERLFGVLWICVDQAAALRKTHGVGAHVALLDKVARAMQNGLRPGEELGRWGEDEFLIIAHERTREALAAHAQKLDGLARTADFRWWGDKISLTVSIGAAQVEPEETLAQLLGRAQAALLSAIHAGGNQIVAAPGRHEC